MSAISLKSISGITSITTPAGVDNQFTLHNNNTTEAVKLDTAGNLHFHNHLNITGVSTASNFKTGTSNLHNTGLNVFDLDVDGHTELDNVNIAGIVTVSSDGINAGILDLKTGNNLRLRFSSGGTAQFRGDTDPIASFDRGSANSTNVKWGYLGADRGIISSISNEFRLTASGSIPMTFHANSAERLRINSTGDIGINYTGTPNATLDIRTNTDPSNGLMCFIRNNAQNGNGAFYGMDVNSVGTWSVGMPDNTNVLSVRNGGQGNSGTEYLRIASNYLVTVGNNTIASTTQPSKLRVQGSYVNAVGPFGILEFKNRDDSGQAVCSIRGVRDGVAGGNYSAGLTFHTNSSNPASASDGDHERLRITSNGNVGIGIVDPDQQLEVSGIIKAGSYFQGGASGTATNNWHFGAEGNGEFRFYTGNYGAGNLKQTINNNGDVLPGVHNTSDLGSSSKRWRNVYTTDLQLSNEGKTNDVDGTWGNYTIQEGESELFLINNRNGKKYVFLLKEVL